MTDKPDTCSRAKTPSLIHNWISVAGIILAASSLFAAACLFAIDFFRGLKNPYMGILTYIIAPMFLITGLLLIAIGALSERHRRRKLKPHEVPRYLCIDFNIPHHRHAFLVVAVVTMVFLLLTAFGSYHTYEFTESVMFCGETCHTNMKPEFTAYQESPHARVACVQCHIGPGATWFVKSKLSGAYQVYATLLDKYPRPIPAPIKNLRPAQETCEQCHWPRKFYGAVERVFHHYLADEKNSPWTIRMLMTIGGGDPSFGRVGGIHWHMNLANKIEYIHTDKKRQVIPWVRMTDLNGRTIVYQSTDNPLKPEQIAAAQPRVMDCIDCHNRPSHIYNSPAHSVELAMSTGRIAANIPQIKKQAVLALIKNYSTMDDALRGIAEMLTAFYQSKYPRFMKTNSGLITQAIAEVQTLYQHNFFPSMKVNWRVYDDNIGHKEFVGCFRCHDGRHVSAAGKTITHDCKACHIIIAQGPGEILPTISSEGLEFKHPVDISGMWQQMKCTDCHDGALVE